MRGGGRKKKKKNEKSGVVAYLSSRLLTKLFEGWADAFIRNRLCE